MEVGPLSRDQSRQAWCLEENGSPKRGVLYVVCGTGERWKARREDCLGERLHCCLSLLPIWWSLTFDEQNNKNRSEWD